MCRNQILVGEIEARRQYDSRNHLLAVPEEVMVVRITIGRKRQNKSGSPAAAGAPAALGVVGGGWWDIAEMDNREVADVDTKLHGW
jgi:hypothetical protein